MQWPFAMSMNYVPELCSWPMTMVHFVPRICSWYWSMNNGPGLCPWKSTIWHLIKPWSWIMAVKYIQKFCTWTCKMCGRSAARPVVDVHESCPWNMSMDLEDMTIVADYVNHLCHWFKIVEYGHGCVTCTHDHILCQWSLSVFLVRGLCTWKLLMSFVRTKHDLGLCAWEYCILLFAYRRFTDVVWSQLPCGMK